jgi:hypothetical protein
MAGAAKELFAKAQRARKLIFKRYLIWFLIFFASIAVQRFVRPFPDFILMAVWLVCGAVLLSSPIRRLQKMPCPYCHYPARFSMLPFRRFRCVHCHRSIGEGNGDETERLNYDGAPISRH